MGLNAEMPQLSSYIIPVKYGILYQRIQIVYNLM